MTLINLPEGRTIPAELGGGVAIVPLDGLPGCYTGLSGWMQHQWPELDFEDYANEQARRAWWRGREAIMDALADGQRPVFPPEFDWAAYPPDEYGIGDSPEQILAHPTTAWIHTDPREFVVIFSEIRREDQPSRQGWRFHKHGRYIGVHNVEWEYLAEQDGERGDRIDSVVTFHIIHVKQRTPRNGGPAE
ncbi:MULTISPECIES: hypothetical protein [Nocardia]|uniref:hypothetical protein n=1 Tax=Nocardia TaxID=1817 RepID=UPI0024582650|nr:MULTISPECIES: hypothetical protein [Nocardia]